jgi:hypothetical protein
MRIISACFKINIVLLEIKKFLRFLRFFYGVSKFYL